MTQSRVILPVPYSGVYAIVRAACLVRCETQLGRLASLIRGASRRVRHARERLLTPCVHSLCLLCPHRLFTPSVHTWRSESACRAAHDGASSAMRTSAELAFSACHHMGKVLA